MVSARYLLLVSVLLVIVLTDSGADGCPSKLKGVFKKIGKSFKLRKAGKSASKASSSAGGGCKNPFFPCKGGGAASVVTDAAKLAKKAQKQKEMRRNLAIGAGTAIGGLAVGGAVSGVVAAKKKAEFEKL